MAKIEICHCDLSGDIYVIEDRRTCEVCRHENLEPFNAENVKKAFGWYADQLLEARSRVTHTNHTEAIHGEKECVK